MITIEHTPTNPLTNTMIILLNFLDIDYNVNVIQIDKAIRNMKVLNTSNKYPLDLYWKLMEEENISDQFAPKPHHKILQWESYLHSYVFYEVYCNTALLKVINQHDKFNILENGLKNQAYLLSSLDDYLENRSYILDSLSICDMSVFSYLSSFDYFFQVRWYQYANVKRYYSALKSIGHFQKILFYCFDFLKPPKHYNQLDF